MRRGGQSSPLAARFAPLPAHPRHSHLVSPLAPRPCCPTEPPQPPFYSKLDAPLSAALKSVTIWPAQIFGIGDKLGSPETGKLANVVVTTGDILEARTDTKYLFIDGRPVLLDTRHTELYMQFKDRP